MKMHVDVNERSSIEAAYSHEDFLNDGQKNCASSGKIFYGLLIEGSPDRAGTFYVSRHALSLSAAASGHHGVLLCPFGERGYRTFRLSARDLPAREDSEMFDTFGPHEYEQFVEAIVQTAHGLRRLPHLDPYRLMGFQ